MVWAEAELRGTCPEGLVLPQQATTRPFGQDRSRVIRQACREGTALSGASVVVAQDAAEAFPTLPFADETPELGARVDEAIGSPPGRRSGVARAGGRSSWRTRCGCGDKHSFGPGRRSVKRLNGPMAKVPQAPSAVASAVGLSILTLRGRATASTCDAASLNPKRFFPNGRAARPCQTRRRQLFHATRSRLCVPKTSSAGRIRRQKRSSALGRLAGRRGVADRFPYGW
jgi:hypothetical protein